MDPNSNEIPGLGLPSPTVVQSADTNQLPDGRSHSSSQPPVAAPPVPPTQPLPDDTSDGLDEEWVNKAKAIVERTKDDPFQESRELNKVRADYLKTRYNKHIKVGEDQSQ